MFSVMLAALVLLTFSSSTSSSRLTTEHPNHPLVVDVSKKDALFDECAARYEVPALAA